MSGISSWFHCLFTGVITEVYGQCENGWIAYDSICYKVVDTGSKIRYDSATSNCNGYGGGLVKVNSPQIRLFLIGYLNPSESYWIGLKDVSDTNDKYGYKWAIDGEIASYYTDWADNEPDHWLEKCAVYEYWDSIWGWHDVWCTGLSSFQKKAYYICQKGLLRITYLEVVE